MTDNEIIKVLEICTGDTTGCGSCPLNNPPSDCTVLDRAILDLIKRQQTKIEELSEVLSDHIRIAYSEIKSEAITEFAEKLKDMHKHNTTSVVSLVTLFGDINKMVKEMTEDINDT